MTDLQEKAMRMALEALEAVTKEMLALRDELAEFGGRPTTNVFHQSLWDSSHTAYADKAIPAAIDLREALAQPEQEPVQNMKTYEIVCPHCDKPHDWTYLQREWVGLTDEEIAKADCVAMDYVGAGDYGLVEETIVDFAKAIEAKLKEKNT